MIIQRFPGAVLAAVLLLTVACDKKTETPSPSQPASAPAKASVAAVDNGVQVVRVRVTDDGYEPAAIELTAGTPAKIIFSQESKGPCAAQVHVPAFGVPKTALPFGKETSVEFLPKEGGSFTWMCGMDMMKGTILVKKG